MADLQASAAAVHAAAEQAAKILTEYSEKDAEDSCWESPDDIFAQLDAARNQLTQAWAHLDATLAAGERTKEIDQERVRVAYMDMVTDAFADVLEDLRQQQGDELDVDILVDCLQSGLDLWSSEEKELLLQESSGELENEEDDGLTPHERRRRQLGFQLEPTSTAG